MACPTILLVTPDENLINMVRPVVDAIGKCQLEVCDGIDESLTMLDRDDICLIQYHFQGSDDRGGYAWLVQELAMLGRTTPVVVLSDRDDAREGTSFFQQGAADYLPRPFDLARLAYLTDVLTVRARHAGIRSAAPAGLPEVQSLGQDDPFLFCGPQVTRILSQVKRLAPLSTSILLQGETGTGKTRLARIIHELSPRRDKPFIVANCGSLSTSLIESELFGHVRGAFTGADLDRSGKLALGGAGTVLLDDIDALPLDVQAKLLRVVDERVFEPVGSNRSIRLEARLISASNRPLQGEVAAGRFRADLYYRLKVAEFVLPPLRNRRVIIRALAQKFAAEFSKKPLGFTPGAMKLLEEHDWPGNIREFRNAIELACALCSQQYIDVDDLAESIAPASLQIASPEPLPKATLAETTQDAEISLIVKMLHKCGNNRLRAALELGVSRVTLYRKLHKYGLI